MFCDMCFKIMEFIQNTKVWHCTCCGLVVQSAHNNSLKD